MAARKWFLSLLSLAITAMLTSCGGGSTTDVHNQVIADPPAGIAIAFKPAPPPIVAINAIANLTAIVSNDSSNKGVDWSLTCSISGNCGTLNPLHTDSGKPVTYTPPSILATNTQSVTIAAFATADHNQNVLTNMSVTAFGSILKGRYVIETTGVDISALAYQFGAVINLDGNGKVTSGEQTYSDTLMSVADTITGGTYFIGPDGRGKLTLNTADQNIGQQGIETFSLVVLSGSQALIAKIDDPNIPGTSSESSTGTMDLQTSVAPLKGGYAFAASGNDINTQGLPTAVGGVLNVDSANTISGAGSVSDQDIDGSVWPHAAISGTVSNPDSFGAVKFTLTADYYPVPMQFTGYIVDGTHIKLIENDVNVNNATGASTAGLAIAQGSATGTFTDKQSFTGNYVFGIFGQDLSGLASSLSAAGVFTADGKGNLASGFTDEYLDGLGDKLSEPFKGTYRMDAKGTGRVTSSLNIQKYGPGFQMIFYLTGNGNPPLILDSEIVLGSVATGIAYPASPQIAFSGRYGVAFTQGNFGIEDDVAGQMTADPTGQTLTGTVDTNYVFSPAWDTALTGTFQPSTKAANRYQGTLSNQLFPQKLKIAYYLIDANHGIFVETDPVQVTYGYFATRTPVCKTCP